jgi:hypothetical protein
VTLWLIGGAIGTVEKALPLCTPFLIEIKGFVGIFVSTARAPIGDPPNAP